MLMQKIKYYEGFFRLFCRGVGSLYLFFCWGVGVTLFNGQNYVSLVVVAVFSFVMFCGHWFFYYWALMISVAVSCVANIFLVFAFFPVFQEGNSALVGDGEWFALITLLNVFFLIIVYKGQKYLKNNKVVQIR